MKPIVSNDTPGADARGDRDEGKVTSVWSDEESLSESLGEKVLEMLVFFYLKF